MERFLKEPSLLPKKQIYIDMCMNLDVLNFGLLNFHSDSLLERLELLDLKG